MKQLTPQEILSNLRQGPMGDDPAMMAYAAGQMSEGVPNTIKQSIEHEKSIIQDLIQLLKRLLQPR